MDPLAFLDKCDFPATRRGRALCRIEDADALLQRVKIRGLLYCLSVQRLYHRAER
jgi:hypothetical protein